MNEEKRITNFEAAIICGVIVRIAQNLALKEKNIQERIGEIMGGKILDPEAIKIYDEGAESQQTSDFIEMVKDGVPLIKAKKYTRMSDEKLEQVKKKYNL
ncbi:MAG: hypothetical protein LIO75_02325 [Lachnospiraceae bacterium]|nr:hypothetical protein [Lachnospiraceae bacterium]